MLVCQAGTVLCGGGSGGRDREPPGVTSSLGTRRRRGELWEAGKEGLGKGEEGRGEGRGEHDYTLMGVRKFVMS